MILEVDQVHQSFRTGFWMKRAKVLHGISLQVPEKSIFGFLGANGAGKTTLIHLIAGLRRPYKGSVKIFGQPASSPIARAKLGYLPERPYFYEHLTGEQLLEYFGALSGMSKPHVKDRIPVVLEAVRMKEARKVELKRYSKGMLQRVGIAQALLHDPQFLVLDEPMSGLDPLGRKEIRELMIQMASEGRTIFFSTHFIPDVESLCDRVALIQKGRLIGSGPIRDFIGQEGTQVEMIFSGIAFDKAKSLVNFHSIRELPDSIRGVVDEREDSNQVISKLLSHQAKILSVAPIRPSLESFFERGK
jgi:ABC-2 type transport system ATP-binding protein